MKEAGVRLPDPGRPEGRRNNRKMMFDRMMRERWIGICEEHGIKVDRVPQKGRHQKIDDYKRDRYIEAIERSRMNTHMVGEIVKEALGEIPADKLVTMDDGAKYVSLPAEEFGELKRAAEQMALDKEDEVRKDREAAAALERADRINAEAEAMRESNARFEAEIMKLREKISSAGILADVVREGMKAIREPGGLELEAMGAAGQAYDASKYASVYEAMDWLVGAYLERAWEHGQEKDGRGRD